MNGPIQSKSTLRLSAKNVKKGTLLSVIQAPRTTEAGLSGTFPQRIQSMQRQAKVTDHEEPEKGVGKPQTNVKMLLERPGSSATLNLAVT